MKNMEDINEIIADYSSEMAWLFSLGNIVTLLCGTLGLSFFAHLRALSLKKMGSLHLPTKCHMVRLSSAAAAPAAADDDDDDGDDEHNSCIIINYCFLFNLYRFQ